MSDLNQYLAVGRITRDVECRTSAAGRSYARVGVALNRWVPPREGAEGREETDFVDAVAFGKLAERLPGIAGRGTVVLIRGRLTTTERDGRRELSLIAEDVQRLGVTAAPDRTEVAR